MSDAGVPPFDEDRGLSFEAVHKKYQDPIHDLILRSVGGDVETAQDLTVETFTNAYRAWDRLRDNANIAAWLHDIALNVCSNYRKQRHRADKDGKAGI